jgi:glycosyltransferase involved in cell wall biosynthesis
VKATIGLPLCNDEKTLADAIRSVFAQSFQDWELILVDDGSQDRSLEIARSVDDPRVRVLSDGINKGLPTRLNQITELAQGDYIVRMDADDMMHPSRLDEQLSVLDERPEVDVVGSAMYSMNESCAIQGIRGNHPLQTTPHHALAHGILVHVTVVARRQWFVKHPYDKSLWRAQDRDLWCRSCLDSKFFVTTRPLMYVRETMGEQAIRNYLLGCKSDRDLIRKYGPSYVGKVGAYRLIGKSYMKSVVHKLAHALGFYGALIRRRNSPLALNERESATKVVQEIRKMSVPGFTFPSMTEGFGNVLEVAA